MMAKVKQISPGELKRRVEGYLNRMDKRDVPKIPLDKKGFYYLVSGTLGDGSQYDSRGREIFDTIQRRFIDVIAYAVQQSEFCGDWCTWNFCENPNHGYVQEVEPTKVKGNRSLDYLVSKREK